MIINYTQLIKASYANIISRTPRSDLPTSGNLARKTFYAIRPTATNGVVGKIYFNAPYAAYVNYGYKKYPNSWKLKQDQEYIERGIMDAIKPLVASIGGIVK